MSEGNVTSHTFEPSDEKQASILEKVRKLIAQAEGTTHEGEAMVFMQKANELMESYAISSAMLDAAKGKNAADRGKVTIQTIKLADGPANVPSLYLLNAIAKANRCECWYSSSTDVNNRPIKIGNVCGFESDVTFVEMLFTSLSVQMMNAAMPQFFDRVEVKTKRKGGETLAFNLKKVDKGELKHGIGYRIEWMQAYAERIQERFWEEKRRRESGHTESMALALRDRSEEVRDHMADHGIRLSHGKSLTRNTDYGAREHGRTAANHADMSGGKGSFKGSAKQIGG